MLKLQPEEDQGQMLHRLAGDRSHFRLERGLALGEWNDTDHEVARKPGSAGRTSQGLQVAPGKPSTTAAEWATGQGPSANALIIVCDLVSANILNIHLEMFIAI